MVPLAEYTLTFEQQQTSLKQASKISKFEQFKRRQMNLKEANNLSFNDFIIMFVDYHYLIYN